MENLSISNKLKLLVMPLLLCMLTYSGLSLQDNYQVLQQESATERMIDLSIALGELIHCLQIERGASTGFIRSSGAKFAAELPKFQNDTDQRMAAAFNLYRNLRSDGLPASISERIESAQTGLQMLVETRQAISQLNIDFKELFKRYTQAIARLQATNVVISESSNDSQVTKLLVAYNALVNTKEFSGQERALMTGVFAADRFEQDQYRAFVGFITTQQAYQGILNDYLSADLRNQFQATLASAEFSKVDKLRTVVFEKANTGGFGVDSVDWFASATARINSLHDIELRLADKIKTVASGNASTALQSLRVTFMVSLLVIFASIGFAYWMSLFISAGINALHSAISRIAANRDLTIRLKVASADEIGLTSQAFNQLMDGLHDSIQRVSQSAYQVLRHSEAVNLSSNQMAVSTTNLSNSASSMAAAIEEMSASIQQVSNNANQVQTITEQSNQFAEHGTNVILQVISEMAGIADAVRQTANKMRELDQHSTEINSIVQVIKEIADQTNLLALNASIEAARAGDQGRGFAVVADEVRNLSKRTTHSVQDISGMISGIQKVTVEAVNSMDVGVNKVDGEVLSTQSAGESIRRIQLGTKHVSEAVTDISNAIREQSSASSEIGRQVERVAQLSEENNFTSMENARTARELENLANQLQNIVSQFKIS